MGQAIAVNQAALAAWRLVNGCLNDVEKEAPCGRPLGQRLF